MSTHMLPTNPIPFSELKKMDIVAESGEDYGIEYLLLKENGNSILAYKSRTHPDATYFTYRGGMGGCEKILKKIEEKFHVKIVSEHDEGWKELTAQYLQDFYTINLANLEYDEIILDKDHNVVSTRHVDPNKKDE